MKEMEAKIEEEGVEVLVRLGEQDGMRKKGLESLGGKGKNLALLAEAGFPVPTAFCLTSKAFKDHLEDVIAMRKAWNSMNGNGNGNGIGIGEEEKEKRRLEGLQGAIRRTEIRTTTRDLIRKTIEEEFEDELVAVRSSATAEGIPLLFLFLFLILVLLTLLSSIQIFLQLPSQDNTTPISEFVVSQR
jgi:hypothetical protein